MQKAIIFIAGLGLGILAGYYGINAIKQRFRKDEVPFKYETFAEIRSKAKENKEEEAAAAMESYSEVDEAPKHEEVVVKKSSLTFITLRKFREKDEGWKQVYLTYIPDSDTIVDEHNVAFNGAEVFGPIFAEVIGAVNEKAACYIEDAEAKTVYEVARE